MAKTTEQAQSEASCCLLVIAGHEGQGEKAHLATVGSRPDVKCLKSLMVQIAECKRAAGGGCENRRVPATA